MFSHPLAQYFWLAYILLVGTMLVWSTTLFFKQKTPASGLMLGGSIAGPLGNFATQAIFTLSPTFGWDVFVAPGTPPTTAQRLVEVCSGIGILGHLTFHAGLLIYALRLKQQSTRLAELEAILEDQGRNPRSEEI